MAEVQRDPREGVAQAGKPAWNRRKPARYEVHACTPRCSLGQDVLGDDLFKTFHSWFEQAFSDYEIGQRSDRVGHHVSYGAIARHRRNHLVEIHTIGSEDPLGEVEAERVDHITILERLISKGAGNIPTGKISPDLLLKAMDMHYKLTQGRVLDDTLSAIRSAMASVEDTSEVSAELNEGAVRTPAELAEAMAAPDE